MIYLTLGEAIRRGIPLYSEIHDNKPPLLYVMAAIAGNLFWFKALLTLWLLTTVFIFLKFTQGLFHKNLRRKICFFQEYFFPLRLFLNSPLPSIFLRSFSFGL